MCNVYSTTKGWKPYLQEKITFKREHDNVHDRFAVSGLETLRGRLAPVAVLSVKFEVGVSLLLTPAEADKRGPMAPFPLVENAGIQPAIRKKVPAGTPAGAGSY